MDPAANGYLDVPLREHIASILDEQRRAVIVAEQEREKAASALRMELGRQIDEGNERLREHINVQFKQVEAALHSADLLEVQRIKGVSDKLQEHITARQESVEARIAGVLREVGIAHEASEKAILKAEIANDKRTETLATAMDKRFESVNEFRAQLRDQTHEFLRAETFNTTVTAWQAWRDGIEARLNLAQGAIADRREQRSRTQPWMIAAMGAAVTIAVVVVNLIIAAV